MGELGPWENSVHGRARSMGELGPWENSVLYKLDLCAKKG